MLEHAPRNGARPMDRFTGIADRYAKFRPDYPREMVDFVFRKCNLRRGDVLVDVSCGTGISSRLFALRGLQVLGIEPNDDMRLQALEEPSPPGVRAPVYLREARRRLAFQMQRQLRFSPHMPLTGSTLNRRYVSSAGSSRHPGGSSWYGTSVT